MARLIATSPFEGLTLEVGGGLELVPVEIGPVTFLQPLAGAQGQVSAALQAAFGAGLPGPGQAVVREAMRVLWCGPGQALLVGATLQVKAAAVIDQSDAWAILQIKGEAAADVLARLTPLDLRPASFAKGQTARTLIGHMTGQITPIEGGYELMVYRSMAGTLVHDLTRAARFVAGRVALG